VPKQDSKEADRDQNQKSKGMEVSEGET